MTFFIVMMTEKEIIMKLFRKSVAFILAVVSVFTFCVNVSALSSKDIMKKGTALAFNALAERKTGLFTVMKSVFSLAELIGNNKLLPDNTLEVNFRESVADELCTYIKDNSDLDIECILNNLPIGTDGLQLYYKLSGTDTTAIRNSICDLSDRCHRENVHVLGDLLYFFGAYLSGIENVEIYTEPVGNDGTSQVKLLVHYADKSSQVFPVDVYFSPDGVAYGNDNRGILGTGYECSVYDLLIYTTVNCWMRDFGFDLLYDIFCYATPFFNYITRRYKFEYDGREWMIQAWKGNYVITNGAEVGVYSREKGGIGTYYSCYDGVMDMSLRLSCGDKVFFDRSEQQWWISGFKISRKLYSPTLMTAEYSLELPNVEMAEKFRDAVNSDPVGDAKCTLSGRTAYVVW